MCGIVGYQSNLVPPSKDTILLMAERIASRGPDSFGSSIDEPAGLAFGHRRLSVLDLSDAGHQPMMSPDQRYLLIFNGQIYNHLDIRASLEEEGYTVDWKGHSDTETLLISIQFWGLEKTLEIINGMFAFALWDKKNSLLSLARDRMGEKPLYYGTNNSSFVFASELKAITSFPGWVPEIDKGALSLYLRYAYVPGPHCIYNGMNKLMPGCYVQIKNGIASPQKQYWSLSETTQSKKRTVSDSLLIDELEQKMSKAVSMRMHSDVPLGAFLSGGIDSSAIVSMMQANSDTSVKTFTIGFDVPGYNEAENARDVARHLGTENYEMYVTPTDALNVVPSLPEIWDEPFADSSQIPTLLLSKFAREHVTVALSGDGGDELFCGYNRYGQGYSMHKKLAKLPKVLLKPIAGALNNLPAHTVDKFVQYLPTKFQYPALGDRLNKLGLVLSTTDEQSFYRTLVSQFQKPDELIVGGKEPLETLSASKSLPQLNDFRETMMYLDSMTYLPDDILTKVDRASMATSLEARVPFLDHDLVEFAWTLPLNVKIRNGKTKWILRKVLERHVPNKLIDRPKMGFGIPIEHWLQGPLRDWAEGLLSEQTLKEDGLFNVAQVRAMWNEHCNGAKRWHHQLWVILMFQAWKQAHIKA